VENFIAVISGFGCLVCGSTYDALELEKAVCCERVDLIFRIFFF